MKYTLCRMILAFGLLLIPAKALSKTADAPFFYHSDLVSGELFSPATPQELRTRADSGDAAAMVVLAEAVREHSEDSFVVWLRRAAEKGNARAQTLLAMHLMEMNEDAQGAFALLEQAADQGENEALSRLAQHSLERGEPIPLKKLERWLSAVIAANPIQIYSMTGLREYPAEDVAAFLSQLRAKAEKGDAHAAYMLGYCQAEGIGTSQNAAEAKKWLTAAAEQGHGQAAWLLYATFSKAKQWDDAGLWLRRAVEHGNDYALRQAADFVSKGGEDREKIPHAAPFLIRAAEQGNPDAAMQLAQQCRQGLLPGGKAAAEAWYEKAATGGYFNAWEEIQAMYAKDAPPNPELAAQWQRRISEDRKDFDEKALLLLTP